MIVRVVHFSDWHGNFKRLPEADLYICTGDMLKDYRVPVRAGGVVVRYDIVPEVTQRRQLVWLTKNRDYRQKLGIGEKPVVCVRGNHERVDLAAVFGGDVWEVTLDSSRTTSVLGLTIGGCRGVPHDFGRWSDEFDDFADGEGSMEEMVRDIQDVDILVTHCPPLGILDSTWGCQKIGSKALAHWLNARSITGRKLPKLHCFGHVHEAAGVEVRGDITFSNAATTLNVIEVEA